MTELLLPVLVVARLVVFALALGLTLISFRAYQANRTSRLETAFIGFAFLTMGIALTTLRPYAGEWDVFLEIVEAIPFIIGFGMLYLAMYR